MVSDDDIETYLLRHSGQTAVDALIDAANAAGGPDNVTVALIEYEEEARQTTDGAPERAASTDPATPSGNERATRLKRLLLLAIVTAILLVLMLGLFVMSSVMSAPSAPSASTQDRPTSSYQTELASGRASS